MNLASRFLIRFCVVGSTTLGICLITSVSAISLFADDVEFAQEIADAVVAPVLVPQLAPVQEAVPAEKLKTPDFLKFYVNVELSFIKRAARPTKGQMDKLVEEARKAFDSMNDIVLDQNQPFAFVPGQRQFWGPNQERFTSHPLFRVRKDALRYAKSILQKEKFEIYFEEAKQRDRFEREAALLIIIDIIDVDLALEDNQRNKLKMLWLEQWKDIDLSWAMTYQHNPGNSPTLPPNTLETVLNDKQKNVWKRMTRNEVSFGSHIGHEETDQLGEQWLR